MCVYFMYVCVCGMWWLTCVPHESTVGAQCIARSVQLSVVLGCHGSLCNYVPILEYKIIRVGLGEVRPWNGGKPS